MSWGNNPLKFDEINLVSSWHKFIVLHIDLNTPERELKVKLLSCVWLFPTPWTAVYQAPASVEFSKQEYWTELPFPSPEDLPDSVVEPRSSALQADVLPSEPPGKLKTHLNSFLKKKMHTYSWLIFSIIFISAIGRRSKRRQIVWWYK